MSQCESEGNMKGSGSGKDRGGMKDRNMESILVDYQTEELETEYGYLYYEQRGKRIGTDYKLGSVCMERNEVCNKGRREDS